jgi:hypothetical protein
VRLRSAATLVALFACAAALATKPALRLERIDPTLFPAEGKIRVFASLVELEGQVDEGKPPGQFVLRVDGKHPLRAEKVEPFRVSAVPLDLVLVIETAALYGVQKMSAPSPTETAPPTKHKQKGQQKKGKAPPPPTAPVPTAPPPSGDVPLDRVKEALATLLEGRPAQTRVLVIDYGGEVTPHPPFRPAPAATGALDELQPDDESGDLRLVDGVRAALVELNRKHERADGEAPPRRLIVVVSDGLNAQMDRSTFRALGDAAAHAGVPIHSIAFSPADQRGPLLNLGEISKRSNGTFRWAKNAEDLKAQIETLADELDKQYVLTFAPAVDKLEGHSYSLECDSLRSNALRYETGGSVFGYTGPTERRSLLWTILRWAGYVVGGLVAVYLVFAIGLRLFSSRAKGPKALLVFMDGPRQGQQLTLPPRPTVLGKGGAIVIDDPAASTRHCQIDFDGAWRVTDLQSTNGTWLDGARIDRPAHLQPGQTLQIGQTRLRFMVQG